MFEKILNYDHVIAPQERYWDCGPASTQIVLNSRGIIESEDNLIRDIGTTTNGTDDVSWVEHSMDRHGFDYSSDYLRQWPPTNEQKELFWQRFKSSVDADFGCVINIDVTSSNYPRGVLGSANPAYGGGEIFHYIAGMGYHDGPDIRAVWIADPGFRPYGYWIALDQLVTCIVPKGYCYLTNQVAAQNDSVEAIMATNQEKFDQIHFEVTNRWPSRSKYFRAAIKARGGDPDAQIDTLVGMGLNTEGKTNDALVERLALLGDKEMIGYVKLLADAGDAASKVVYDKCPKT